MSQTESAPYSYLRLSREVVSTDPLEEFLESAKAIGKKVFGIKGNLVSVKLPATREEELQPGHLTRYQGTGRTNARVFDAPNLRVTLFERRAAPSLAANDIIQKAYDRLNASYISGGKRTKRTAWGKREPSLRPNPLQAELRQIEEAAGVTNRPVAKVLSIANSTRPDYAFHGTEYSLVIKADKIGKMLLAQAAHVEDAARKIVVAQPLFKHGFTGDENVLQVPFVHVPNGSPDDHALFLESLNENLEKINRQKEIELPLERPLWLPKTVS